MRKVTSFARVKKITTDSVIFICVFIRLHSPKTKFSQKLPRNIIEITFVRVNNFHSWCKKMNKIHTTTLYTEFHYAEAYSGKSRYNFKCVLIEIYVRLQRVVDQKISRKMKNRRGCGGKGEWFRFLAGFQSARETVKSRHSTTSSMTSAFRGNCAAITWQTLDLQSTENISTQYRREIAS